MMIFVALLQPDRIHNSAITPSTRLAPARGQPVQPWRIACRPLQVETQFGDEFAVAIATTSQFHPLRGSGSEILIDGIAHGARRDAPSDGACEQVTHG